MSHAMTVIVLTYEGPAPERRDHIVRRVFVKAGATPQEVVDYVGGPGRPAMNVAARSSGASASEPTQTA